MPEETFLERQEESISIHIFSVSAAMVGVCLTVIGLLNINEILRNIESVGDELIAVTAIFFLAACMISYLGVRTKDRARRLRIEKIADIIFLTALVLTVGVSIFIVLQFI